MFQLNMNNNRQHQTLAFNSLILNNIFNLANCFNQFGEFNLRAGFKSHPFFVCVLLLAVFIQVCLTELNAFGLENLNPMQWFVCFVFGALSALISPLTGQQQRSRAKSAAAQLEKSEQALTQSNYHHHHQQQHHHQASRSPAKVPAPGGDKRPRSSMQRSRPGAKRNHHKVRKSQAEVTDN